MSSREKLRRQAADLLAEQSSSPVTPIAADLPVQTEPAPNTSETDSPTSRPSAGVPPPVFRIGDATQTMQFDVPGEFEPLRKRAAADGRTKTDLILDALAYHGPNLMTEAVERPLLRFKSSAKLHRWLLAVSPEEQTQIDEFVTAISNALGGRRTSKTAAIAKLLEQCL